MLGGHLKSVTAEIERKKRIAAYHLCVDDTGTQAITRKSTELTRRLITDQLRNTFQPSYRKSASSTSRSKFKPRVGQRVHCSTG
jgi:hypothetical protein